MNIPYAKHDITEDDIQSVVASLRSGFLTGGQCLARFEEKFSTYVGSLYSLGVSSGTAGLHLAVEALVKPESAGKTVLVPSMTFAATANAVIYSGLKVEFVDIDAQTLLIDTKLVEEKLAANPSKYIGLIAVDFAGMPLNIVELSKVCKKYGIWLIEDAAHALGAVYGGSGDNAKVGNGQYADLTVFSFHPAKHITTGEGGMVTTNNAELFKTIQLIRSHAIDRTTAQTETENWYYRINRLGYNYRISELQAALGISQLERMEANLARRREIAKLYDQAFSKLDLTLQPRALSEGHAYHLYIIKTDIRKELYEHLKSNGIFAQVHYVPLHTQPFYKSLVGDVYLPNTEHYYQVCLSLPMFPTLTIEEQSYVIKIITDKLS